MELVNSLPSTFQYVSGVRRTYHDQDGSITFAVEVVRWEVGSINWDLKILTNHSDDVFFRSCAEEDLILLDRASRMDFAVLCWRKLLLQSSLWCFIQEHEFENGHLNYEYYYVFKYAKRFDYFITATDLQKEVLEQTLAKRMPRNSNL